MPRHRRCEFLFVHRSTEADARALVSAGAAQAAAPASPMLLSNSRREIRLSSIAHRPAAVLPSRRGLGARVGPGSGGVQHRVLQTPVVGPHPVHPLREMQTPGAKSLQSASLVQEWVSLQKTSSAQRHLASPNRWKQYEPSPTPPLHVPQMGKSFEQSPHGISLQRRCALFFLQRSTDAEARTLVNAGAAQAAVPAKPTFRSNSRRVTRLGSTVDLRFVWMGQFTLRPGPQRRNRAGTPEPARRSGPCRTYGAGSRE
jgi:plasmid stability protein